jgi:hypothetical protein
MDSITISTELNKIQNIHYCLSEDNPITYIVFQEQFRNKLSPAQNEMISSRIDKLYNKSSSEVEDFISSRDFALMLSPLSEKYEEHGTTIVTPS